MIAFVLPVQDNQEDDKTLSKPLTIEVISQSISLLCKIGTALSHAYVRLDVHDKVSAVFLLPCTGQDPDNSKFP